VKEPKTLLHAIADKIPRKSEVGFCLCNFFVLFWDFPTKWSVLLWVTYNTSSKRYDDII